MSSPIMTTMFGFRVGACAFANPHIAVANANRVPVSMPRLWRKECRRVRMFRASKFVRSHRDTSLSLGLISAVSIHIGQLKKPGYFAGKNRTPADTFPGHLGKRACSGGSSRKAGDLKNGIPGA
jgi:hypothetical protein